MVVEAGQAAEKVVLVPRIVPQRLKPRCEHYICGTAEAVPLSKTEFPQL